MAALSRVWLPWTALVIALLVAGLVGAAVLAAGALPWLLGAAGLGGAGAAGTRWARRRRATTRRR